MALPTYICDNCGEVHTLKRGRVWYDVFHGKAIRFCSKECKTAYHQRETTPYPLADAPSGDEAKKGE